MSRTARQSLYPSPAPPSHWSALSLCSAALSTSLGNVQSAVEILDQGTRDLPRLAGIVQSRRMFDLITEPDVLSAQRALANEMRPQIEELISRAEGGLEGLKERERGLKAKLDKRTASSSARSHPSSSSSSAEDISQDELDALEQKLAELQRRKERLGREVEVLEERAAGAVGGRR
ncbi:hypothetical protein JCM6882_007508 [Rhodosporidiobolus microsporus]